MGRWGEPDRHGGFGPDSDLDFLMSFEPGTTWDLFDLATMQVELEVMNERR